jgi:hypothetical protein
LQAVGAETVHRKGSIPKTILRKNLGRGAHSSRSPTTPWTRRKSRDELLDVEVEVDGTEDLPGSPWDDDNPGNPQGDGVVKIDETIEPIFRRRLQKFVQQYNSIFRTGVGRTPALVTPYKFKVDDKKWKVTDVHKRMRKHRPQTRLKDEAIQAFVERALHDGILEQCDIAEYSHMHLAMKANGKFRFCVDYRLLSDATESAGWPLPNIQEMLNRIGRVKAKHFAVIDLTSGYHQTPIDESCKDYTAFITSRGIYRWTRVPMGLKGAPSYFQHQMQQ